MPGNKRPAEEMQEAGMLYYQLRNFSEVARQTGIPGSSIKHWHQTGNEHFARGMELQATLTDKRLSAKMLKVVDQSLDLVLERLEDPEQRKELKTKDLAWAGAVYHDKTADT